MVKLGGTRLFVVPVWDDVFPSAGLGVQWQTAGDSNVEESGMSVFEEVDPKQSVNDREESILQYWRKHDIANKSVSLREGSPRWIFYEGPPTANGRPGIHHVLARTLKDVVCR